MVRAAVPEIVRIVDVTDHDAGLNPYYSHDGGRTASPLARAVPEGVISLEDGRHVVDSAYLAPRLGLDVEALRVEMRAGRVLSREERGEGEDADCGLPSATATVVERAHPARWPRHRNSAAA